MDGRGPPSSSFLRQQRFRDLLRSPTLTHSWPVVDLQNMERLCKFWQNSPKCWTVGLGKKVDSPVWQSFSTTGQASAFSRIASGISLVFPEPGWQQTKQIGAIEAAKLQLVRRGDYTSCRNCSDGWTVTPFAATAQFLDRQRVAAVDKEVGGRFSSS